MCVCRVVKRAETNCCSTPTVRYVKSVREQRKKKEHKQNGVDTRRFLVCVCVCVHFGSVQWNEALRTEYINVAAAAAAAETATPSSPFIVCTTVRRCLMMFRWENEYSAVWAAVKALQ